MLALCAVLATGGGQKVLANLVAFVLIVGAVEVARQRKDEAAPPTAA